MRNHFSKVTRDVTFDNINKTRRDKVPRYTDFPPTVNSPPVGDSGMEGEIIFNRTPFTDMMVASGYPFPLELY